MASRPSSVGRESTVTAVIQALAMPMTTRSSTKVVAMAHSTYEAMRRAFLPLGFVNGEVSA